MKLFALIAGYATAMAFANLCLKWCSLNQGWKWWAWFAAANLSGFLCVVLLPFALKLAPSQIVYAFAIGSGFCLLQLTAHLVFKEPMSHIQWAGVVLVASGIFLLQWKTA